MSNNDLFNDYNITNNHVLKPSYLKDWVNKAILSILLIYYWLNWLSLCHDIYRAQVSCELVLSSKAIKMY